jgi:hypothetical protein
MGWKAVQRAGSEGRKEGDCPQLFYYTVFKGRINKGK